MIDDTELALVWDRPEPAPVTTPSPLSRSAIVESGIRLADSGGLEGVSFRKVAADLEVGPMRLYRFVGSKGELLELMIDQVYAGIESNLSGRGGSHEQLIEVGLAYREASFRHAWFVDLLGGRPHVGPHALAVLEATARPLAHSPRAFTPSELWSALGAVNAYLFGAIRSDVIDPGPLTLRSGNDLQDNVYVYLRRKTAQGDLPTLRQLAVEADRPDLEQDFIWGLNVVLDGLL